MTGTRQALGQHAEELAASWLQRQGLELLARNVRTPVGEIDLVARDGQTVCCIEVRSRRSQRYGTPEESITRAKQRHMLRAAQWYMQRAHGSGQTAVRIDVVTVRLGAGDPEIRCIRSAVDATDS